MKRFNGKEVYVKVRVKLRQQNGKSGVFQAQIRTTSKIVHGLQRHSAFTPELVWAS
jgi:hypothetical protein